MNAQTTLSARQVQCLLGIARGSADPAIATEIGITRTTVRYHVYQARRRLGATSRAHAVALAVARGRVTIEASR
ncbi:MAG: response regulator transcription factor [Pararhodobacter sp.]